MQRTNIYLDEDTVRNLKLLAVARETTMSDLVRDAVRLLMEQSPLTSGWQSEVRALLDRGRSHSSQDLTAQEIAAEIQATRADAKRARSTDGKKA